MKMSFKLETHLHTSEASACASASGELQAINRKKAGYDGIIVTDHFYRGNCRIDRSLPWEEFIDRFCIGYENAKRKGDEIGLKVFFGWEEGFNDGSEMLVYGLDKTWLKAHPEMITWTPEEHYERIHADGGFVVQPHPFRERNYIKGIHLYPHYCDACEVINACNYDEENERAFWFAKSFDLPMTGGSDIHNDTPYLDGGILLDKEITDIKEYADIIMSRKGYEILGLNQRI